MTDLQELQPCRCLSSLSPSLERFTPTAREGSSQPVLTLEWLSSASSLAVHTQGGSSKGMTGECHRSLCLTFSCSWSGAKLRPLDLQSE